MNRLVLGQLARIPLDQWNVIERITNYLEDSLTKPPTEDEINHLLILERQVMIASFGIRCAYLQCFILQPDEDLWITQASTLSRSVFSPGYLLTDYECVSCDNEVNLDKRDIVLGHGTEEVDEIFLDVESFFLIVKERLTGGLGDCLLCVEVARKETLKYLSDIMFDKSAFFLEMYLSETLQSPLQFGHRSYTKGNIEEIYSEVEEECKMLRAALEKKISQMS